MDLVFTVNSTNGTVQCIDVVIIESHLLEEDRIFTVELTTSSLKYVTLEDEITTVTITDTNSKQQRE